MPSDYACRDDNFSLKPIPEGYNLTDLYCRACPSGPFKGPKCLRGHSYVARQLIREIVEQRVKLQRARWGSKTQACLLCGAPVEKSDMHRECAARVRGLLKGRGKDTRMTRAQAIQVLIEMGQDTPPS